MLCSNCGQNEAAVYINKTVNGKTTSTSLCRACAAKLGIGGLLPGLDLLGMLGGGALKQNILKQNPAENSQNIHKAADSGKIAESDSSSKRCSACGRSFNEIAATGRVGCAVCYKLFASELGDTVTGIHGIASYVGRQPKKHEPVIEPLEDVIREPLTEKAAPEADLREQLLEAVRCENYEEAARLRDLIRASEKENRKEGE